jgi:hypothetical protein
MKKAPELSSRRLNSYSPFAFQLWANFLDEVDVSWEVCGDFHANGLLANLWLVPDLHNDLLELVGCVGLPLR